MVVAINGCSYECEGQAFEFPAARLGISPDTEIILVAGDGDKRVPSVAVRERRRRARSRRLRHHARDDPNANHYTPIFHDLVDGRWVTVVNDLAGQQTVRKILDAVRLGTTP